jgi:hypothetical protein
MNFTFVRAERSQEENQERAFIAASRRQDRDFKQRLESLQKASELHFARTGKRFEVTQAQVEHNGPLMELGDDEKRRREARRYAPYTLNRPSGGTKIIQDEKETTEEISRGKCSYIQTALFDQIQINDTCNLIRNEGWYPGTLEHLEEGENLILEVQRQSEIQGSRNLEIEETQNVPAEESCHLHLEDLPTSFFEMEDWQEYHHEINDCDVAKFLQVHFPRSRVGTPNVDGDSPKIQTMETQPLENERVWTDDVLL